MAKLGANEIGIAYVTLLPSMKTFNSEVRKALKDDTVLKVVAASQGVDTGEAFAKAFTDASSKFDDKFLEGLENALGAIPKASKKSSSSISDITKNIKAFNREIEKAVKNVTLIAEVLHEIKGTEAGKSFAEAFNFKLDGFDDDLLDALNKTKAGFEQSAKEEMASVEETIKKETPKIATTFSGALKDALSPAFSGVTSKITEYLGGHAWVNVGVQAAAAIGTGLLKVEATMQRIGGKIVDNMVKQFAKAGIKIGEEIVAGVKAAYSKVASIMIDMGTQMSTQIVSSIKTAYSKVGSLMENIGGNQVTTAAQKLGINLGSGITNGLQSAQVAIGNIVSNMISSAASAVTGSLSSAISRVDTMENFPKIMANMNIGSEEATAAINTLSEAIDGLPTTLDAAALGTERLVSKNGDIEKSAKYFTALNNAIIAGGASTEIQSSAIEQLTQAYSKGSMDMMEWRSLQMAMPAQLNQIASSMSMTADELGEGLRTGTIAMDDFMDTLVTLNEEGANGFASFSEQARTSSKTITTALTNVQNRINKFTASAINWVGQENIFNAIESVSKKFAPAAEAIFGENGILNQLNAKDYFASMGEKFSQTFTTIIEKAQPLKDAIKPLVDNALPTALNVVNATLDKIITRVDPFISKVGEFLGSIPDMVGGLEGIQPIIDAIVDVSFDTWTSALDMWQKVIPEIAKVMPTIITAQGQVTQALGTLIGNLAGTVAPLVGKMTADVAGLVSAAEPLIEDVVNGLAPVVATIEQQIVNIASNVIGTFSNFKIEVDGEELTLFAYVGEQLKASMEDVGETINYIFGLIAPYSQDAIDVVTQITGAITSLANDVADDIVPIVASMMTDISALIARAEPLVARIIEGLAPVVVAIEEEIVDIVNTVISALGSINISDIGDQLAETMHIVGDNVAEIIKLLAPHIPAIVDMITRIINALAPVVTQIFKAIEPYIDPLMELIAKTVETLAPVVGQIVEALTPLIDPFMELIEKAVNFIANHAEEIVRVVEQLVQFKLQHYSDIIDLADKWLPLITDIITGWRSLLDGLYQHTLKPIIGIFEDIGDFLSDPSWDKFAGSFTGNTHVSSVRPMASGGIAYKPTTALIAEAGTPEAVVPLSAQGIETFTKGLANNYKTSDTPQVNVVIETFVNNDTTRDARQISQEIGRDTIRQLKMQGVYA